MRDRKVIGRKFMTNSYRAIISRPIRPVDIIDETEKTLILKNGRRVMKQSRVENFWDSYERALMFIRDQEEARTLAAKANYEYRLKQLQAANDLPEHEETE